jgi:hypothetical protein
LHRIAVPPARWMAASAVPQWRTAAIRLQVHSDRRPSSARSPILRFASSPHVSCAEMWSYPPCRSTFECSAALFVQGTLTLSWAWIGIGSLAGMAESGSVRPCVPCFTSSQRRMTKRKAIRRAPRYNKNPKSQMTPNSPTTSSPNRCHRRKGCCLRMRSGSVGI